VTRSEVSTAPVTARFQPREFSVSERISRVMVRTALLMVASIPARAEIPPFYALGPRSAEDLYAAGVLYFRAPRYAGSDEIRSVVAPSATIMLNDGFFADPISGIGYNASADPRFEYGPRATIGLGRQEPAELRGLGRIHHAANVGGFANFNVTDRFQLQSSLRYGSGYDHRGALADAGASYDLFQQDHVSVTVDASISFANARYMKSFYGVSTAQSMASGYPAYAPAAGAQWHTAGLSLTAPVHPKALAYFSVDHTWLEGPARASPLVRKSSWTAIEANVSYAF
jgi:outer membrane scaffolding protein for murein synthesis (MipA/OmpV family)